MTAIELRAEVKKLVDSMSDLGFLEQLKQLLLRSEADRATFVEMNRMADLSDEAIRKGEVYAHKDVAELFRERHTQL